ncbi:MAG: hypothetical protein O2931_13235 [Planctomycetota bacterium]|nr:hypothetical protein [Planctomycetota bacterium]MDA1179747.1 hypothetical protein [Planctomycetota bacterium]
MNRLAVVVLMFLCCEVTVYSQPTAPATTAPLQDQGWQGLSNPQSGKKKAAMVSPKADANSARNESVPAGIPGTFPAAAGQVWKEYEIRLFSQEFAAEREPERFVLEWILKETGNDTWFGPPLGALSVTRDSVTVYHVPAVQSTVDNVIRRLVRPEARRHTFTAKLMTVSNTNWRTKALPALKPLPTQTAGLEAWTMTREDSAVFMEGLKRRNDVRDLAASQPVIRNGETHALDQKRPKSFPQSVRLDNRSWPGYQVNYGQVDEGFSLAVSPLLSLDGQTVDAVVRGSAQQIDRITDTWLSLPTVSASNQRVQVQVPQVSMWQIHERFNWSVHEVLLISRGIVVPALAAPAASGNPLPNPLAPLTARSTRADLLLVIEGRGADDALPPVSAEAVAGRPKGIGDKSAGRVNSRGRY